MTHRFLWRYSRLWGRVWARLPGGCHCNVCGHAILRFLPYRGGWSSVPPLMRELQMIGSDVERFECPVCGSHDRERHLIYYLDRTDLFKCMTGAAVLHLAPERHVSERINKSGPTTYIKGDLYPTKADIKKIDLLALPFSENTFDIVIANHVLEHVNDDTKALREIARVLKPGGNAILQTPFSNALEKGIEDPGIQTELARLHAYGQEDHVRIYGRDWIERFEAPGLRANIRSHAELLGDVDPVVHGVNQSEPFMWFIRT